MDGMGTTLGACSIAGCSAAAMRSCATCLRPLCRECWCRHEVELVRAANIAAGAFWEPPPAPARPATAA